MKLHNQPYKPRLFMHTQGRKRQLYQKEKESATLFLPFYDFAIHREV
jgi:hypothetical protein